METRRAIAITSKKWIGTADREHCTPVDEIKNFSSAFPKSYTDQQASDEGDGDKGEQPKRCHNNNKDGL